MRSDDEILKVPAEHFPYNLSDVEKSVWLRGRPEDDLPIALRAAAEFHGPNVTDRIVAEIDRRVSEKALLAVQPAVLAPPKKWYLDWRWLTPMVVSAALTILRCWHGGNP